MRSHWLRCDKCGDEDGEGGVDLVEESDGRPTLLVFVHGANRPAARLTRVLMNYAETRTDDGLYAATIWLDDDGWSRLALSS